MSRGQTVVVLLLLAVVGMGGLLIAKRRPAATPAGNANTVLAYGPCGLQGPLMQAKQLFSKKHPEIRVDLVMDNANVLVNRVLGKGERPDVFLAPGETELKQLRDKQLVDESTVKDYGTLDMVLIAPRKPKNTSGKPVNSLADLGSPSVKYISMGNPQTTSLGYYGEQVMRGLKIWDGMQSKLLLREAPLEAYSLVESGDADAGIAYLTCPLDTNPEKIAKASVRVLEKIPRDIYPPIRLQLGMLKQCKNRTAAQTYIDFMASEEAQQVMAKDGILPAEMIKR